MTKLNSVAKNHIMRSTAALVLAAIASLTGCAQNTDARLSWERRNTLQDLNRFAYLDCVNKQVSSDTSVIQFDQSSGELLIGSSDPQQASGIVKVSEREDSMLFSVYQADAWQTKGELVNAAYACSHG
ncbi:hypothetical protein [Pseudomonas sp. EL_65y_Pfl2_R95]|uniref:hypothetical protein n=1 Tax=Pseudomonas sp. EL_65y_Pfl2_R95 TaxID=3088698 RepID=UPI0030DC9010